MGCLNLASLLLLRFKSEFLRFHMSGAKGARLFTHSYLGLGFDAALQKAADLVKVKAASLNSGEGMAGIGAHDPCLPLG